MPNDIDNSQDYLDVRDIIARVEALEDDRGDTEHAEWAAANEFEAEELETLTALLSDMAGYGGDEQWRGDWYPVTLIRDSYFTEYTQELCEDCGDVSKDLPRYIEIDWEKTARNIRMDYTSTEFDGVTYWYR